MEVSKRITCRMDLLMLGAELGVQDYTIENILQDYTKYSDASYQVLVQWRQEGIDQQREASEMKRQLKDALCSKHVGLNQIVAQLESYF